MPTYTISEIRAHSLLHPGICTTDIIDYHKSGNELIELAERIKSERAIAAMERF